MREREKKKKSVPGPHATSTPLLQIYDPRISPKTGYAAGREGDAAEEHRMREAWRTRRTHGLRLFLEFFRGSGGRHTAVVSGVKVYEEGGGKRW